MSTGDDFEALFRRATGWAPYDYQRELGQRPAPPAIVAVPTGAGKTYAALLPWLADPTAPRRLIYALPMRSLVEQTVGVVQTALDRVGDETPVVTLMGGVQPGSDWRLALDKRLILVGTIDMLLSAALNRDYAASRFNWPISFGLLNNDCRWIFDEVQLMGPARTTSAQLDGLRARLGTLLPCQTTWMSATVDTEALRTIDHPDLGDIVSLTDADRAAPALATRLNATKHVERVDVAKRSGTQLAKAMADAVLERHRPATRTITVVNRVELAQEVYRQLGRLLRKAAGSPALVLLHSRFRPQDRRRHMDEVLADVADTGTIVVSTQVIEAGVDLTSALLATETAPFSSMVQRFGRCNRDGAMQDATILWFDRGELDAKAAAPYLPEDLAASRAVVASLEGRSAAPAVLDALQVDERRDPTAVLRWRDLLDLFDTAPDLSGSDIDIAPYIRGDDDRTISVFFRDLAAKDREQVAREPMPHRDELVTIPISALGKREVWQFDFVDGRWARSSRRPSPGTTVMLDVAAGGYSQTIGWTGQTSDVPERLSVSGPQAPEAFGSDPASLNRLPVTLAQHLAEVQTAVEECAMRLGLDDDPLRHALARAAALHDIGKAHDAFQAMLRATVEPDADAMDGELLAKGGSGRAHNDRRHFRHELMSTLALRDGDEADLVRYLVAAHHGRVRLSIRPAPDEHSPYGVSEDERFALGIVEGDELPVVRTPVGEVGPLSVSLVEMELGGGDRSWSELAHALRDEHGPFVLGYLEAVLRIADWRASGA